MKKAFIIILVMLLLFSLFACSEGERVDLTEGTFFFGMTSIQLHPADYYGKHISFDCFTYRLTDVNGREYMCGVRKCSAGYGCKCGKDSVIGFILLYDGEIPEPKNQNVDTPDKSWIHVEGKLASAETTEIRLFAYDEDGQIDYQREDSVKFCTFAVESLTVIEDYSSLAYYVVS